MNNETPELQPQPDCSICGEFINFKDGMCIYCYREMGFKVECPGAPAKIFLLVGEEFQGESFQKLRDEGEVLWCEDKHDADDIEYIRADLVAAELATLRAQVEALQDKQREIKLVLQKHGVPTGCEDWPVFAERLLNCMDAELVQWRNLENQFEKSKERVVSHRKVFSHWHKVHANHYASIQEPGTEPFPELLTPEQMARREAAHEEWRELGMLPSLTPAPPTTEGGNDAER